MKTNETKVFSNAPDVVSKIENYIDNSFKGRPYYIFWVRDNVIPRFFKIPKYFYVKRVLIVFEGLPVALESLTHWQQWAIDSGAMEINIDFVCSNMIDDICIKDLINKHCKNWSDPLPIKEPRFLKTGDYIKLPDEHNCKDDPNLLTMMFGEMGKVLTRVGLIRKRFHTVISINNKMKEYLNKIDSLIENEDQNNPGKSPDAGVEHLTDHLPRLLLVGDTGTGKTLIARYLQAEKHKRPPRIVIPEYLNKEDMFEYDLFGYVHGAYTGGSFGGSHGILLENIGGVIFIDEIGEANEIIQAKLLAYLDDYQVRPRGWKGDPFYCPTLIIAATNRNLEELIKNGQFRPDLFARFTDYETIPPLSKRVESLPFILDCLLQRDSINPDRKIKEFGCNAFKQLSSHDFRRGNFRELEEILRGACAIAQKDGRDYICISDLSLQKKHAY